jgi:molybdopterin molybdotransferase
MALTPLPEALERILATAVADPEREQVSLAAAMDRYCAEAVQADIAVPPADNSAMDGYAVASGDVPGTLVVSQRAPAGALPAPLAAGTAARIFTGAEIPVGADAVILQEDATVESDRVSLPAARPGQHIRRRGDDIRPGDELVARGQRIRPQDIGLLASVGNDTVWVFAPLRVVVLTTGDELREPGSGELGPGQIFNSNRLSLAAQIRSLGMNVVDMGNLPDDPGKIGEALERAAKAADCIVTAGGVSVGEEDHVRGQIEERGVLDVWKLAIKPGKPLAFGQVYGTPIFGLPGNPVSAFVTFALVAKPWLIKRQGGNAAPSPRFPVKAGFALPRPGTREEFLRVKLSGSGEAMRANLTGSQSSAVLTSLSEADGVAVIAPGKTVAEGDWLEVIPLSAL